MATLHSTTAPSQPVRIIQSTRKLKLAKPPTKLAPQTVAVPEPKPALLSLAAAIEQLGAELAISKASYRLPSYPAQACAACALCLEQECAQLHIAWNASAISPSASCAALASSEEQPEPELEPEPIQATELEADWQAALARFSHLPVALAEKLARTLHVEQASRLAAETCEHPYLRVPNPSYPAQWLYLDPDQQRAVQWALEGRSFCLIGSAGSGKTLTLSAINMALVDKYQRLGYPAAEYKLKGAPVRIPGPPIFNGCFPNKATSVLRQKLLANDMLVSAGYGANISTLHNLLEYAPVDVWDPVRERESRRFLPQRNASNPLRNIRTFCIDEASMVPCEEGETNPIAPALWNALYEAMEQGSQVILIGDINQIPPVGGKSILAYGLLQLPILELTYFHRQAAESPIILNAHRVLEGEYPERGTNEETGDKVSITYWPKEKRELKQAGEANHWLERGLPGWLDKGLYVPGRDMFIMPMAKENNQQASKRAEKAGNGPTRLREYVNVTFMNKVIASELSVREERLVYTIAAGFTRLFLAVGDQVLVAKEPGVVTEIAWNSGYVGPQPPQPQQGIDYHGHYRRKRPWPASLGAEPAPFDLDSDEGWADVDAENLLAHLDSDDPKCRAASHRVTIELDSGRQLTLSTAGDFGENNFQLGYAITGHKSQGSEWHSVFAVMHNSHAQMCYREWLYTAMTRAKNKLYLIGEEGSFKRAVLNARIQGKSLEDKIRFFTDGEYISKIGLGKLSRGEEE